MVESVLKELQLALDLIKFVVVQHNKMPVVCKEYNRLSVALKHAEELLSSSIEGLHNARAVKLIDAEETRQLLTSIRTKMESIYKKSEVECLDSVESMEQEEIDGADEK